MFESVNCFTLQHKETSSILDKVLLHFESWTYFIYFDQSYFFSEMEVLDWGDNKLLLKIEINEMWLNATKKSSVRTGHNICLPNNFCFAHFKIL